MLPAVAVNVAVVAPTATVVLAGTLSSPLLLLNDTVTEDGPAAFDNVTVHEAEVLELRLAGEQFNWLVVGGAEPVAVAVPPDALVLMAPPDIVAPSAPETPTGAELAPPASVTVTVATVPFAMRLELMPLAMQI